MHQFKGSCSRYKIANWNWFSDSGWCAIKNLLTLNWNDVIVLREKVKRLSNKEAMEEEYDECVYVPLSNDSDTQDAPHWFMFILHTAALTMSCDSRTSMINSSVKPFFWEGILWFLMSSKGPIIMCLTWLLGPRMRVWYIISVLTALVNVDIFALIFIWWVRRKLKLLNLLLQILQHRS